MRSLHVGRQVTLPPTILFARSVGPMVEPEAYLSTESGPWKDQFPPQTGSLPWFAGGRLSIFQIIHKNSGHL